MANMSEVIIRVAAPDKDAQALREIYKPYVEETAITFEYAVPTVEEFKRRIKHTLEKYPYLVAEENGKILGYVYVSQLGERKAYAWAVETSIYIAKYQRSKGSNPQEAACYQCLCCGGLHQETRSTSD